MTIFEVRQKYLDFFKARGHAIIPSAPLVPKNDPTTLFTGSGMQPLVPYLLGAPHPSGRRLVNAQKCFRAEDIEEVGDNRHTTFFEMLGNWSLGDYFKKEQLPWLFEFLTREIGLAPEKLYVTVFSGDAATGVSKDEESIAIWRELFARAGASNGYTELVSAANGSKKGMGNGSRIFGYGVEKNWWSRSGPPSAMPVGEPGGPDSEVFYDFGAPHVQKFGEWCHPNCDCGRFLEIGNSVFMEYRKTASGFEKLPQKNVDFGGGLERITAAANDEPDLFKLDVFKLLISTLEEFPGVQYSTSQSSSFRIIADHMRAVVFLLSSGVSPSNTDRGYFVRRLLRRALLYLDKLAVLKGRAKTLAASIIDMYAEVYPELAKNKSLIEESIDTEEARFRQLARGWEREFEKGIEKGAKWLEGPYDAGRLQQAQPELALGVAFKLVTTHGIPIEVVVEEAKRRGYAVDLEEFRRDMAEHKEISRAGMEKKFKGGLADTSELTTRLHTAHHLLLKALQIVLGPHVKQRGSNITRERLRIDFCHGEKLTEEQKREVERIVNEKIKENLPVIRTEMGGSEAERLNAEHEFGAKYPERVSVYSVGPLEHAFSIEFCGGPHVNSTGELTGRFKIIKEEAVSAGVRRIKAVLA